MAPLTYRLRDRELLAQLMAHPGRGTPYTPATLAETAHISRSMIGHLLTGERAGCAPDMAQRITDALGVALLILFTPPTGPPTRTPPAGTTPRRPPRPAATGPAALDQAATPPP